MSERILICRSVRSSYSLISAPTSTRDEAICTFRSTLGSTAFKHLAGDRLILLNHYFAIDREIGRQLAAFEQLVDPLVALFAEDTNFVFKVAPQTVFFFLLDRQ